jgi:hypothetical protein
VARLVAVHGINNTYSGPRIMASEWVPALLHGVGLPDRSGLLRGDDIACVFYGDLFRQPGRMLGDEDLAALGPEDISDAAEAELLAAWWGTAAESDPGVVPQAARTLGLLAGVQAALGSLTGSRFLAGTTERLCSA